MRLAKCGKEWKTVKPTHKKIYIYINENKKL